METQIKRAGFNIVWSENELDVLRKYFNGRKENNKIIIKVIKETYGVDRTVFAIKHKASLIGMTNGIRCCDWTPKQIEKLQSLVGKYSPEQIGTKMGRSLAGIKKKCHELGLSLRQRNDWFTLNETAKILGVSKGTITKWIESKKLCATRYDGQPNFWHITRQSIKKFLVNYPSELTGRNVDLVQIIDILVGINYDCK